MMDEPVNLPEPVRMKLFWRLVLTAAFFGPAVFFAHERDFVLSAVCAGTGMAAFSGFRAGALYLFALLAGISVAITFAADVGHALESQFTQWFGTTGLANRLLSISVSGLALTLICSTLLAMFGSRLVRRRQGLDVVNRWAGFSIGGLEGLAAIIFFLGGMLVIEPIEKQRAPQRDPNDGRGQFVSKLILNTAEQTRASRIGPWIEDYNPFTRIPRLNKVEQVQRSVKVLSDPQKIQGLLHHPSIQQLQRRPEVKQAVSKIKSDPDIQQVLNSGRPMDRKMAMTLMNHPAVLELIDQPGFMEEASRVIHSTGIFTAER